MPEHRAADDEPSNGSTETDMDRTNTSTATDRDPRAAMDAAAAAEREVTAEIRPGGRAMLVAGAVLVLVLAFALPHSGAANGWEVLADADDATAEAISLPSRIFTIFAATFGVVASMLALVTRRWVIAWVALAGCAVSSVFGMLAVWSRQTLEPNVDAAGVGAGLLLGWASIIFLTFHWLRVVWSRTITQMDAKNERLRLAAEAEAAGEDLTRLGMYPPRMQ